MSNFLNRSFEFIEFRNKFTPFLTSVFSYVHINDFRNRAPDSSDYSAHATGATGAASGRTPVGFVFQLLLIGFEKPPHVFFIGSLSNCHETGQYKIGVFSALIFDVFG